MKYKCLVLAILVACIVQPANCWAMQYLSKQEAFPYSDSYANLQRQVYAISMGNEASQIIKMYEDISLCYRALSSKTSVLNSAEFMKLMNKASKSNGARNYLQGAVAERMFLDGNPSWKQVSKPNAPMRDVYNTKTGSYGQIKTHGSGNPNHYINDMLKDNSSKYFYIPDDHVEPVKAKIKDRVRSGRMNPVKAARQSTRIKPMGFSMRAIEERIISGIEANKIIKGSGPISKNIISKVAFKSAIIRSIMRASNSALKAASAAMASNVSVKMVRASNGILLFAFSCLEIYYAIDQQGGLRNAVKIPQFWEEVGGLTAALLVAWPAFEAGAAVGSPGGPLCSFVCGAAFSAIASTAAYVGGAKATKIILDMAAPELIIAYETRKVTEARDSITLRIEALMNEKK